jgi:hypothetical protein
MYTLAAGASGVGVVAFPQAASAKIVYTPADVRIVGTYNLDLNHDGITDFSLWKHYFKCCPYDGVSLLGFTPKNNSNAVVSGGSAWAAALPKGARVGSTRVFDATSGYMAIVGHDYGRLYGGGPWTGNIVAYLGLKFQIKGKTHYGWARLHVVAYLTGKVEHPLIKARLTGYAYETIPNKAIITGKTEGLNGFAEKPATLGRLALGRK